MTLPEQFKALVITLSDRASRGEYEDLSGPLIVDRLSVFFGEVGWKADITIKVIPDDAGQLRDLLKDASKEYHLVFTTGGTGIGPRDITVDVIKSMMRLEIPGIMDLIRIKFGMEKPNALLSRSVAGLIDQTLVYALPGSVKAVKEYMAEIVKTLQHTIYMQYGIDAHPKH